MTISEEPNRSTPIMHLQELLTAIEASGRASLAHSEDALLKSIVEAAAKIFNAAAASILLVDEKENVLEFKVAYGAADHDLVGAKIPMDKGIAGYVVMTGQPISISDVHQDARFNRDFAKSTGYVPSSILATPLLAEDRVIGVMEVLDKIDAASFGMQDMELLALFAKQAAIAIDHSQNFDLINNTLVLGLQKIIQSNGTKSTAEILSELEHMADNPKLSDLMALANIFHEISSLGEAERQACTQILQAFATYRRSLHRKWS